MNKRYHEPCTNVVASTFVLCFACQHPNEDARRSMHIYSGVLGCGSHSQLHPKKKKPFADFIFSTFSILVFSSIVT